MQYVAPRDGLLKIVANLRSLGYTVVAPTLRDGAVCLSPVESANEIAKGVVDSQEPGRYRAKMAGDGYFSAVNGPTSAKKYLHPGRVDLFKAKLGPDGPEFFSTFRKESKLAIMGLRPCDLKAVYVQDRVLLQGPYKDPVYASLRADALLIVVNCTRAGSNCFCASMGTGPKAVDGFDLAITELSDRFVLHVPGERPAFLDGLELAPASEEDLREEEAAIEKVKATMGKRIEHPAPAEAVYESLESPVWEEVSQRCLACGNCTMVCPTCFCTSVKDATDLVDGSVTRVREWDSCMSRSFTYSHGYNPRYGRKARYRQFVMHKFAYWTEQFGAYGCVGCGRCITWCPVGIDIAETVNAIVKSVGDKRTLPEVVKVA